MEFVLDRKAPFSFACRACGRCCAGKIIMAGPHEALGMARHLGITTTDFLARYSDHGATALRFGTDGRCVFVSEKGCAVHPRRPLVCRLYPLGRAIDGTGAESFAVFPKEEGCEGEFGTAGTVGDFLESQGVAPYIEWSARYGELYRRMLGLLGKFGIQGEVETGAADAGPEAGGEQDRTPLSSWQDIDASLAGYCAAKGIAVPESIEAAVVLHLRAMEEWLDDLEAKTALCPAGEGSGGSDKDKP